MHISYKHKYMAVWNCRRSCTVAHIGDCKFKYNEGCYCKPGEEFENRIKPSIMIKNYLKTAFRNLIKNKVHSFINIAGLSAGMAVAIVISLWIGDELSFDKYHKNYDRIAQVMQHVTNNGEVQTWP